MYIPASNELKDKKAIVAFMKRFSFATIISAKNNYPVATHLPFLVKEDGENLILLSHFAKANSQWHSIAENDVLVIFSEPHAYISPKNYEKELNVPTWNYVAIHCYGKATIIDTEEAVMQLLEHTINNYEADYKQQWDSFPESYKTGMAKAIVAFSINVNDIQAKQKLSQNKTVLEQSKIIKTLSQSNDSNETIIAGYMKSNLDKANS